MKEKRRQKNYLKSNLIKENNVKGEQRFYIKLPLPVEHKNHLNGDVCAILLHIYDSIMVN